uniref:hypothetical protein n=1 Tax=Segatella hominis TaxID=2518605 RepID=UPI004026EE14
MYRISIDEAKGSAFYVSQFVLEDPAMAHDYNGLDYMVQRSKVTISPKGEIKVKQLNKYKQHIQDEELCANPPLEFGDFLKKFKKWNQKELGDSLFVYSQGNNSFLASSLLLKLLPKEDICGRCWPKDLSWTPCHYIETKRLFLCFMILECDFPKGEVVPYVDYVVALFDKRGQFQKIVNIMHKEHDDVDKKIDTGVLCDFLKRQI